MTDLLRVAAVQAVSRNGDVEGNLRRASRLVERAANSGAKLVVCPEFLATGYAFERTIWKDAEHRDGPTERWLRAMAKTHAVTIGASYLEVQGEDFFNTFTLVDPDGVVCGRVRKESLPAFEGWFCRSSRESKTIDTRLGRVAVGICQDSHTSRFMARMVSDAPDILLMPHSGPCVGPLRFTDAMTRELLGGVAEHYASTFGIPTVMVNKAALAREADVRTRIPIVPLLQLRMRFPGLSTICDASGAVVGRLNDAEDVICGDVRLDRDRKRSGVVPPEGYWARPPPRVPRLSAAFFRAFELAGKTVYAASRARRRAARSVAQAP